MSTAIPSHLLAKSNKRFIWKFTCCTFKQDDLQVMKPYKFSILQWKFSGLKLLHRSKDNLYARAVKLSSLTRTPLLRANDRHRYCTTSWRELRKHRLPTWRCPSGQHQSSTLHNIGWYLSSTLIHDDDTSHISN